VLIQKNKGTYGRIQEIQDQYKGIKGRIGYRRYIVNTED